MPTPMPKCNPHSLLQILLFTQRTSLFFQVWNAVKDNNVIMELLVAHQTLMIQELARCVTFGNVKNPHSEAVVKTDIDLTDAKVIVT